LEHGFYDFPYIGNVIIPIDELIFFRGVESTNQFCFGMAAAQQRIFLGVSGMQKAEQAGLSLSDDAVQARLIFCADFCCLK
jgi:hypothetical protein